MFPFWVSCAKWGVLLVKGGIKFWQVSFVFSWLSLYEDFASLGLLLTQAFFLSQWQMCCNSSSFLSYINTILHLFEERASLLEVMTLV